MNRNRIDKTGLKIVQLLQDGRRSYKEIGQEIGISEATVRSKVNKMIQEGLVEIRALVSPKSLAVGHQTAYIGVRLNSPAMKQMAEAIGKLPGVISVALVTGRFDLILTVILSPNFELIDFFDVLLEKYSDHILLNETFLIYESVNLSLPYPYG